jgi:predicted transposase YbfD/YdcC
LILPGTGGGDYVLALKANEGCLYADIRLFLNDPLDVTMNEDHTRNRKDNGPQSEPLG